ncbi:MAG: DNA gyrase inhibitor YacG [Sedimentisphaerales bacterium]|nr:DNA gyrase inhibitor YacG [Sedimentisphaerales bacterium]
MTLPERNRAAQMRFFPFCSERCKLIDLGAWLDAEYRIPSRPDEECEGPSEENPATSREPS